MNTRTLIPAALLAGLLFPCALKAAPVTLLGTQGPVANRVAVIYIGDGFDSGATDRANYIATVNKAMAYRDTATVAQPFKRYHKFFNYHRIDLVSPESGIDEPEATPAIVRNTPLDGIGRNSTRLGEVSNSKTCTEVAADLTPLGYAPTCSQISNLSYRTTTRIWIYVVLNSTGYYNSGGPLCVFSRNYYGEIALHEGGHAHHQLADEYGGTDALGASEPAEINVTKDTTGARKWAQWLGYNQPVVGLIGAYEGARYVDKGMYRPSNNSRMNQTSQNSPARYNVVSMEKIILDIYARVRPLDAFGDTAGIKTDPESLWVKTVDTAVLKVDWYVDSVLMRANGGETFRLPDTLKSGSHTVRALVYDEIVKHSGTANATPHALDWVRKDLAKLQQEVRWRIDLTPKIVALRNANTGGSSRVTARSARIDRNRLAFDLPWSGSYRVSLYTQDGKFLDARKGSGSRGAQVWMLDKARAWPKTVLLKLEP